MGRPLLVADGSPALFEEAELLVGKLLRAVVLPLDPEPKDGSCLLLGVELPELPDLGLVLELPKPLLKPDEAELGG
jgi:hypothetical protein